MAKLSIFNGISPKNGKDIKLDEALLRIKNGESKDLINKIRKSGADKIGLPAVTFCGHFGEQRKISKLKKSSGLAILDFDKLSIDPAEFRDEVFKVDFIHAAWISPSGKGVKALVRIPEVKSNKEYKLYYRAILDNFADADQKTSDVARLCFESYDKDIRIRDIEKTSIFEDKADEVIIPVRDGVPINTDVDILFDKLCNGVSRSNKYEEGNRNQYLFILTANCNEFGIKPNVAARMMQQRFPELFKDEPSKCIATIRSGYQKKELFGTKTMTVNVADEVINSFASPNTKEPEPEIDNSIEFPVNVFPDEIRELIMDLRSSSQFPIDYSATAFLSTISAIVGNKYRMKVNNSGWETPPAIWHAIIGSPGAMKSHPVKFMLKPVKEWEAERMKEYSNQLESWKIFDAMNPAEQKKQRKNSKYEIVKPIPKEIVSKNTTVEALVESMKHNPVGMLLYKDELISLTKSMGQYKNGGGDDEEFFLESFNCDDYKVARKSQPILYINSICLGIIGTIQPNVLDKISSDNGMLHRFLFTQPSSEIPRWSNTYFDQDRERRYVNRMRELIEFTRTCDIQYYGINEPIFAKIYNYLSDQAASTEISDAHKEYYGKLKTYIPRLALSLIAAWEWFSDDEAANYPDPFSLVFDLIKYYEATAEMVFSDRSRNIEVNSVYLAMKNRGLTNKEMIRGFVQKGFKHTEISKVLGISTKTIQRTMKK